MKRRRERHKNTPTERRCSNFHPPVTPPPRGDPPSVPSATASWCCRRGVSGTREAHSCWLRGKLGPPLASSSWFVGVNSQRASRGPGPRRRPGIGNLPRDREMPTMPQSRPLPRLEIPHADVEMGHWEHTRVRHPFNEQHWVPLLHIPFTSLLSARSRRSATVHGGGPEGWPGAAIRRGQQTEDAPRWDSVGMFRTVYGVHSYPSAGQSATPVHIGYAREVPTPSCP